VCHKGRAFAAAKVVRGLIGRAVGFQHKVERKRALIRRGEANSQNGALPPRQQACIFGCANAAAEWQARADRRRAITGRTRTRTDIDLLDACRRTRARDRPRNSVFVVSTESAKARERRGPSSTISSL